jgi:hypothetical protein
VQAFGFKDGEERRTFNADVHVSEERSLQETRGHVQMSSYFGESQIFVDVCERRSSTSERCKYMQFARTSIRGGGFHVGAPRQERDT